MRWSDRLKGAGAGAAAFVVAGAAALGCSSSTTASSQSTAHPDATTSPPTFVGKASTWLRTEEQQWNVVLSNDKTQITTAAQAKGLSRAAYSSGLRTACQYLVRDAQRAARIPQAPITGLNADWDTALSATKAYAESCLELVAHQTAANFNAFKSDLTAMDIAIQGFNQAVQAAVSSGH
jgi:hypothetical protein